MHKKSIQRMVFQESAPRLAGWFALSALLLPFFGVQASWADAAPRAKAEIVNAEGKVIGKAKLKTRNGKTSIEIKIGKGGLAAGQHGIHLHEKGLCEGPEFKSAGGHYSAAERKHGMTHAAGERHWGDLPNLEVKKNGSAKAKFSTESVTLEPGAAGDLLKEGGTAIVIHEKTDDQASDPAGNSGPRIACGVIQRP